MILSDRQREILEKLRAAKDDPDLDWDLVESGNVVYCGLERTNFGTLLFFLRHCLVSVEDQMGDSTYYKINEWGCRALDDPEFEPEIELLRLRGKAELAAMSDEFGIDTICQQAA